MLTVVPNIEKMEFQLGQLLAVVNCYFIKQQTNKIDEWMFIKIFLKDKIRSPIDLTQFSL